MSATRIFRRRKWIAKCPPVFNATNKKHLARDALDAAKSAIANARSLEEKSAGEEVRAAASREILRLNRSTFHTWMIAHGLRHRTFQLRIRQTAHEAGARETSTRMSRR